MTQTEQAILRYMRLGQEYVNRDVSSDLNIPPSRSSVVLRRLVDKGLVEVTSEASRAKGHRRYRKVKI